MNKLIPISEELKDYIEMLHYESFRYKDLLNTINRDCCPMTDEEWNSSLEYYQEKCQEAQVSLQTAMDTIYELYGEEIGNEQWRVNFDECVVEIGEKSKKIKHDVKKRPGYQDQLNRFYYNSDNGDLKINSKHAKDITIQVTDACNMACTYCYQHNKNHHSMSFEVGKKFIDMILDSDERTNSYITSKDCLGAAINFIGGEPWLEIDLITKLSDYFIGEVFRRKHPWAIKFMFSVCSNGLLHFDDRVQNYIKRHKNHFSYNVSIDGNKELHDSCRVDLAGNGTYDRAIAAVDNFINDLGGSIGSKMTIAPGNVTKVAEATISMINKGYRDINLNCVYEKGWTNDHAKILYWELRKLTDWIFDNKLEDEIELSMFSKYCGVPLDENDNHNWCGGVGLMLAVDWKGDIYPCVRYMESSVGNNQEAFVIGNIEDGINRRCDHCNRVDCMAKVTRKSQSTDECFNCPIAGGCGWCSAYNYECFGTVDKRATFICCMHKARSLANVYYWKRKGENREVYCPKEWAIPIIGSEEYDYLCNMEVGK